MNRPASFDAAVLALRSNLRGNAMKLTRNADKADDLVQDTIEKAFRYHESYTEGTNLIGWLFTIMRNTHYEVNRRAKRLVEDPDGIAASLLAIPAAQEPHIELKQVARAFNRLSHDHREALMGCMDGLAYEEIARDCGTTIGTVKSRVNRARAHLREMVA